MLLRLIVIDTDGPIIAECSVSEAICPGGMINRWGFRRPTAKEEWALGVSQVQDRHAHCEHGTDGIDDG